MISADDIDALCFNIERLYADYNDSIIRDIARRVAKLDYSTATAALQVQRLNESGMLYNDILERISNLTGKSEVELRKMFTAAGVKSAKYDTEILRKAGLWTTDLNLSPAAVQVLMAGIAKTSGIFKNLTMTTALAGQEAYMAATDAVYQQIVNGGMSYTQAMRASIKDLAAKGVRTVTYAGHTDQIDVAIRRAAITGASQTTGLIALVNMDSVGADLVAVSAHAGARPEHQVWQGKVYSRTGSTKKYPNFVASTGYGTGPGLLGWNCRHSFYPWFEGISEEHYSKSELKAYEDATVKLDGKDIPMYEATQMQRGIEREIRYWKRQADALHEAGVDNGPEVLKVRAAQAKMRHFVKETGLIRQSEREGFGLKTAPKVPPPPESSSHHLGSIIKEPTPVPPAPAGPTSLPTGWGASPPTPPTKIPPVSESGPWMKPKSKYTPAPKPFRPQSHLGFTEGPSAFTSPLPPPPKPFKPKAPRKPRAPKAPKQQNVPPLGAGKLYQVPKKLDMVRDGQRFVSKDGTVITGTSKTLGRGHCFETARVHIDAENMDGVLKNDFNEDGTLYRQYNFQYGFAKREVAASRVDELLNLDIVPKTTPFETSDGRYLSLQRFKPKSTPFYESGYDSDELVKLLADPDDPGKMSLLDTIMGNTDRHAGNWMYDEVGHRIVAIDNGLTMCTDMDAWETWEHSRFFDTMERIYKGGKLRLAPKYRTYLKQAIDDGSLEKVLRQVTTEDPDIDEKVFDAAMTRARRIVTSWTDFYYYP